MDYKDNLYYWDVEVDNLDFLNGITIQVAPLDWNGRMGKLKIYKVWEFDDAIEMFKQFFSDYYFFDEWSFIPVGYNLRFDFSVARKYAAKLGNEYSPWVYWSRPHIDLHHFTIVENKGFKGSSLANFSPKVGNGKYVGDYYKDGELEKIIDYVTQEAEAFSQVFKHYVEALEKNPNPWKNNGVRR